MTSIRTFTAAAAALVMAVACGSSSDSSTPQSNDGNVYIDGFDPGPVPDGYTRYVTPVIKGITPGTDHMWCQYVSKGSSTADQDVIAVSGAQSKGGHHVILYAVKNTAPYGDTHDCSDSDMSRVIFLGGIGGEGASSVAKAMPEGTVFRLPAGYSLMANTHFINVTDHPIDGQGVIDIKLAPADPSRTTLTLFTNVATDERLKVPAHSGSKLDVSCTVKDDLDIFMFGNHLHEHGTIVFSELLRQDGSKEMLKEDLAWKPHMTFDPSFKLWDRSSPLKLKKGDVVHTHCEWNNTTDKDLKFPTEMCVGFGFYAGLAQIDCIDGDWTQ